MGSAHVAAALAPRSASRSVPRRSRCGWSRTRSATPATSRPCPWRSLALGLAHVPAGGRRRRWTCAPPPIRLDGGVEAAAPRARRGDHRCHRAAALPRRRCHRAPRRPRSPPCRASADPVDHAGRHLIPRRASSPSSSPRPSRRCVRHLARSLCRPTFVRRCRSARDRSAPYRDGCVNIGANAQLQPCEYGVPSGGRTILLYGDSHAVQWFEPLEQIALQRGWRLVVLAKGGCPVAEVDVPTPVLHYTCPPYRDRAIAWIEQHQPDLVVVGNSYTQYPADAEEWAQGTEATIDRLAEAASRVVLIGDNPASTRGSTGLPVRAPRRRVRVRDGPRRRGAPRTRSPPRWSPPATTG